MSVFSETVSVVGGVLGEASVVIDGAFLTAAAAIVWGVVKGVRSITNGFRSNRDHASDLEQRLTRLLLAHHRKMDAKLKTVDSKLDDMNDRVTSLEGNDQAIFTMLVDLDAKVGRGTKSANTSRGRSAPAHTHQEVV